MKAIVKFNKMEVSIVVKINKEDTRYHFSSCGTSIFLLSIIDFKLIKGSEK